MTPSQPPQGVQPKVRIGGLFRCCLATLEEAAVKGTLPWQVGAATLDCKYEPAGNAQLRLAADGVWEWNHD